MRNNYKNFKDFKETILEFFQIKNNYTIQGSERKFSEYFDNIKLSVEKGYITKIEALRLLNLVNVKYHSYEIDLTARALGVEDLLAEKVHFIVKLKDGSLNRQSFATIIQVNRDSIAKVKPQFINAEEEAYFDEYVLRYC